MSNSLPSLVLKIDRRDRLKFRIFRVSTNVAKSSRWEDFAQVWNRSKGKVHYERTTGNGAKVNQDSETRAWVSRARVRSGVVNNFARTVGRPDLQRFANAFRPVDTCSRKHKAAAALGHASSTVEKPAINGRCIRGRQELIMQVPVSSLRSRDSHLFALLCATTHEAKYVF